MGNIQYPFNNTGSAFTKKIHAYYKQQHVYNARNQNPLPQAMLADEVVRFEIRLYSDHYFF
jgi:hypothetical protein